MGREVCICLLMQYMLLGRPAALRASPSSCRGTEQGWAHEQQHLAAPCGCQGSCLVFALNQLDRMLLRGKVSQPAPGVLTILLVSTIDLDCKAKNFQQLQKSTVFSSQPSLSFCVVSCTILGGIGQQQRTLPIIS